MAQFTTIPIENLHPLALSMKCITTIDDTFWADMGKHERDYFLAVVLINDETAALEQSLAHETVKYPKIDSRTQGAFFIGEYSWYIPAMVVALYLAEQHLPDISPGNLAIRYSKFTWHEGSESGEAECIDVRFLTGRFTCLPDDPAAKHPDARILADQHTLRDELRNMLEGHLTLLIQRITHLTQLGNHTQWYLVADSCVSLFLHLGRLLGNETHGTTEGLAFTKADGSPMNNPNTTYISLQYLEHRETFRARGGCCRYYTISETLKEYCTTYVLHKPEDRDTQLLAYMQRKYKETAS